MRVNQTTVCIIAKYRRKFWSVSINCCQWDYVISGYTTSYSSSGIEYEYIVHDPWPANGTTQPGKDTPVVTSGQKLTRSYEWICNGRTVSSSEGRDTGIWEGFVVVNTSYSTSTILPAYDWWWERRIVWKWVPDQHRGKKGTQKRPRKQLVLQGHSIVNQR